jgi:NAD dependent epimerase/dehydratase family enzyme
VRVAIAGSSGLLGGLVTAAILGAQAVTELLLASARVLPAALLGSGFSFRHPTIGDAPRH